MQKTINPIAQALEIITHIFDSPISCEDRLEDLEEVLKPGFIDHYPFIKGSNGEQVFELHFKAPYKNLYDTKTILMLQKIKERYGMTSLGIEVIVDPLADLSFGAKPQLHPLYGEPKDVLHREGEWHLMLESPHFAYIFASDHVSLQLDRESDAHELNRARMVHGELFAQAHYKDEEAAVRNLLNSVNFKNSL